LKLEKEILRCFRAGVIVIDMSGTVIYRNEIAKKILGNNLVDIGGSLRSSSSENAFHRSLLESLELKYLPARMESILPGREGGTRRMIGFTLSELKDGRNNRTGICAFFKDLTHVEMAEENKDLDTRLRLLGQMAAGLAHEIRNPITSISVHCGLLRMRCQEDTQIASSLSHIESETGKVESIIRECLNFVRPPVLNLSTVSMTQMLERLVADTGKLYPKISFSLRMETTGPVHGEVDEIMFEQALRNIIVNAAQACPPDREGKVAVAARLSKGFWDLDPADKEQSLQTGAGEREYFLLISIKDNGVGIPENVKDKIFVPFFTTKKGGTGIGLSIVQKIINAHRGVLDIVSEPEKGTEFIIKIPLRSSPNA